MSSPPQGVYATNLQQNRGYPLRIPEPSSKLGSPYDKEGLQIGDVGYVDDYGGFVRLFNICFPLPDETRASGIPPFDPTQLKEAPSKSPLALPGDHLFMTGVKRQLENSRSVCISVDTASNTNVTWYYSKGGLQVHRNF